MAEGFDVGYRVCSHKDCDHQVKNHAWGMIKADGWLFQKNGDSWCPDHLPDWYAGWSRKKKPRGD